MVFKIILYNLRHVLVFTVMLVNNFLHLLSTKYYVTHYIKHYPIQPLQLLAQLLQWRKTFS